MNARFVFLAILPLAVGCHTPTSPEVAGTWGGTEASLVLTAAGGTVSYPCGAGTIDSTWSLSGAGTFVATGQHFFGGGPVPVGGPPAHPARYTGEVQGNDFTLTVTLTDLNEILGPFHLVRGGPAVQERCL